MLLCECGAGEVVFYREVGWLRNNTRRPTVKTRSMRERVRKIEVEMWQDVTVVRGQREGRQVDERRLGDVLRNATGGKTVSFL